MNSMVPASEYDDLSLQFKKTFRIAVSGDVRLTDMEVDIIDTPDFQRLRSIKQLGNVYQVFPSAMHSRFEHALGTLSIADHMILALAENSRSAAVARVTLEHRMLARLYALLHDIVHVPFGHTMEDEACLLMRHDEDDSRFERFLGRDSDIGKIIRYGGDELYERFVSIFKWSESTSIIPDKNNDEFVHDLVSDTACADLLDYLSRDNYFCNLGINIEYRFINFLYLAKDEKKRVRVFVRVSKEKFDNTVLRRDVLSDLVRLLEARYLLAERVYYHSAKIVGSTMLARAVGEALSIGYIQQNDLYGYDDAQLLAVLCASESYVVRNLAELFINRKLYKKAASFSEEHFNANQFNHHTKNFIDTALLSLRDEKNRRAIEDSIADEIGASPGDVLIFAPSQEMNQKLADMKVEWKGRPKPLKEVDDEIVGPRLSAILRSHKALWFIGIFVSPALDVEQRKMAELAFQVRFLSSRDDAMRRNFVVQLVGRVIRKRNDNISVREMDECIAKCLERLSTASFDKAVAKPGVSWRKKIVNIVGELLPEEIISCENEKEVREN